MLLGGLPRFLCLRAPSDYPSSLFRNTLPFTGVAPQEPGNYCLATVL